ncbi:MAG: Ig-like domain-containing protein, partial [Janthinobacterium lividum]
GNVSYLPQTITVLDAPSVTSIVRADGASGGVAASATSIKYTVTFSDSVTGVDADDFTLGTTGTAGGHIAGVSGSGNTYTVTVDGLLGDGTLRLDLNAGGTGIQSGAGVAIAGGYTGGHAYTLDHTAPAAPSRPDLLAASDSGIADDNVTRDTTPTFSGTAEVGSVVTLFDSDGSTVLGTDVATDGTWTIQASELIAGTHSLTVKAADAAGNLSDASGPLTVTIVTSAAAPAAPTLAAASDSGVSNSDKIINVVRPTIKGTAEAYAAITVFDTDGTTVLGTATVDAAGAWELVSATLSHGTHTLKAQQVDRAGNQSLLGAGLTLIIDTQAPTAPDAPILDASSDSGTAGDKVTNIVRPVIRGMAEANALVHLYDTDGTTLLGTATANGNGEWSLTSSTLSVGVHTLTAVQFDLAGNVSPASADLVLTIEAQPAPSGPSTPPPTMVDGVVVSTKPVVLPGGGTGTQVVIPVVTPGRAESTGNPAVADIPLATNANGTLLQAQIPAGFGLTASGGASRPAGSSLEQLISSIVAATPGHSATDQGHLTGNGTEFLGRLDDSVSLLVQTIVPTAPAQVSAPLVLTGTSDVGQHTALVIDTTGLPSGSQLMLNAVDFAAIIGAANVTGNTRGQILTGDAASQTFTVEAATGGLVFSGGGEDRLAFESTVVAPASAAGRASAAMAPVTTVLHGGLGSDAGTFNGNRADYTIEQHDGHLIVTRNEQPNQRALLVNVESLQFADATIAVENRAALSTIAGLYRDALGRQADYQGFDFWGTAQKNGISLGTIALAIVGSQEAQALHGWTFTGNAAHDIELLYQGIFGRHSDTDGFAFWTDMMARGITLEQVAQAFVTSAESEAHLIGAVHWDFQV